MPQLPENYSINDTIRSNNIYMNQQYNYDREALKNIVPINVAKFNSDQLIVYNQVLNRIKNKEATNKMFFVDGPGGFNRHLKF